MADNLASEARTSNLKVAAGQFTTVTASDDVVTGLNKVMAAVASLDSAPVLTAGQAQAIVVNQVTAPGHILIASFMATSSSVTTPIPATTFGKTVSWIAVGW